MIIFKFLIEFSAQPEYTIAVLFQKRIIISKNIVNNIDNFEKNNDS